jgi:hypothetical protein
MKGIQPLFQTVSFALSILLILFVNSALATPAQIKINACVYIAPNSKALAEQYRNTTVRVKSTLVQCLTKPLSTSIGAQDFLIPLDGTTGLKCSPAAHIASLDMPPARAANPCSAASPSPQPAKFTVQYIFPGVANNLNVGNTVQVERSGIPRLLQNTMTLSNSSDTYQIVDSIGS